MITYDEDYKILHVFFKSLSAIKYKIFLDVSAVYHIKEDIQRMTCGQH